MTFSQKLGQEFVTKTLTNSIQFVLEVVGFVSAASRVLE